ncbi:MAG TPA: permease prefix domain 1-containing protein, partial [Longimicrobiales bacterium]|nr:permease prefix domain 1-containing protein [Longimicrobiales bacterium]
MESLATMPNPPGPSPLAALLKRARSFLHELPALARSLLPGLLARTRSLLRGLFGRDRVEAEMRDEFQQHIELRTEDLVRQGVARAEARRRAHLEFGHVETHRERARAARGLQLFDRVRFSWLDVKLGLRMLVKHPGLTVVAGVALAVGIPVGMAPTHLADALEAPLPEDPGDRIRGMRYWDPVTHSVARPGSDELELWTETLTSFSAVGAFRMSSYNVASED